MITIKGMNIEEPEEYIKKADVLDLIKKLTYSHYFELGEYIGERCKNIEIINSENMRDAVLALQTYRLETTPKGRWNVDEDGNVTCPFCGRSGFGDFCSYCGADMREA